MKNKTFEKELVKLCGSNSWQRLTSKQKELINRVFNHSPLTESESQLIQIPAQKLSAKTCLFRNPATRDIWLLYMKDGKITVDVPNFSFQLHSANFTKFRSVNPLINLEFEFEQHDQNAPLLLHLHAKGIKRATFQAIY